MSTVEVGSRWQRIMMWHFLLQTHKKICMLNNSQRISTEHWQNTSDLQKDKNKEISTLTGQNKRGKGETDRQRRKKKKKASGVDQDSWEEAVKEERNPHPRRPPNWDQPGLGRGEPQRHGKGTAADQRRAKQKESFTDYQYHCPGPHCLRHSGRGLVLRLGLWRSVLERVWGRGVLLGSGAPQSRECKKSPGPTRENRHHCWEIERVS